MSGLRKGAVSLCRLATTFTRSSSNSVVSQRVLNGSPLSCLIQKNLPAVTVPCGSSNFHTCSVLAKSPIPSEPEKWPRYNEIVYPPRAEGEPRRPAEIFHHRANIKYSYKKLWYIASMIRGMSIDEALKQLSFIQRNGAETIKEVSTCHKFHSMVVEVAGNANYLAAEVCIPNHFQQIHIKISTILQASILLEAQELAVKDHNVEYKSNLFVADSFVGKARTVKGMRKHSGPRFGIVHFRYSHYFVCLREGPPPKRYYAKAHEVTGNEKMEEYLTKQRQRRIWGSL